MPNAPEKSASVTRADVARLSGVSTAVVSYVLNDGPKPVAAHTRDRVLAAVRALNYRPNAAARALSKGTANSIGMLVADSRNPFFAQLIYAVDRRARERGHSLVVISMENSSRSLLEDVYELAAQRVKGIVSGHGVNESEANRIRTLGVPTVLVNQMVPQQGFVSVRVDYRAGARTAVEHLIGHGYEHIGFVGADEGARLRESGWADALHAAGLAPARPYLTDFSLAGGYAAGRRVAEDAMRPRAVFVASDQMAMGVLAALYEAGIRVPEDIAVASFDGTAESAYLWPPLTTVQQPLDAIARAAIDALVDGGHESDQRLDANLVVRRSCGCTAWSHSAAEV